ncbi:hypothetical protein EYF80_000129 [Liparis tanakae]|uniref:Uncharacterized protein n=1 Tax=Liparis tanakae TaxID=230148 RepID=A0A4Z2JGV9_9TELE|nr:hypothetical protein EYF80_000129 [Liparis tanakae]
MTEEEKKDKYKREPEKQIWRETENSWLNVIRKTHWRKSEQQNVFSEHPGTNSKHKSLDSEQTADVFLTDTLLLTCHFLFEQKQLSLRTPCSGGLWVLLAGCDLFTQPRDKVGLPAHPGATPTPKTTTTLPPHTPLSPLPLLPSLPPSDTHDLMVLLASAGAPQYPPSEVRLEPRCSGNWPRPH